MSISVALDAMGGDKAPKEVVAAAVLATKDPNLEIFLVGDQERVKPLLGAEGTHPRIHVVHAASVVGMNEPASQALRRKDCSLRVAAQLVKDGTAQAFVSAGNSGAMMAAAAKELGPIEGIDRPAIAMTLPNLKGRMVIVDAGANVDCSAEMMNQFAVMGASYAEVLGIARPRVALISIGEEECKGNNLTRAAARLISATDLNFVGNVEGNHLFEGAADVIVCDGFVGNVILKLTEGVAEYMVSVLKDQVHRAPLWTRVGSLLMRPVWRGLKRHADYAEYGGAPLLGIRGVCMVCHGRSNARAIAVMVKQAAEAVSLELVPRITRHLSRSPEPTAATPHPAPGFGTPDALPST
ncbi:MAG TPA: phosphate acyltransferase PlsX [Armatimonadota bacterium]|jgi:glycerol-3-phosphate acyltransferase PlsX